MPDPGGSVRAALNPLSRSIVGLAVAASVTLLVAEHARAACDTVYDTGDMLGDLGTVEAALRSGDTEAAGAAASTMETRLPCLGEPVPFMIVGRIYRGIAAGRIASGDEARGREWFLTALEVDPTFDYGTEDLPIGSPIRELYMTLRGEADADPVAVPDTTFGEGRFFLDGGVLGSPRATLGRPHLLQREISGTLDGWVIQSNEFPPEVLAAVVVEAEPEEDPREARRRAKEEERARREAERAAAAATQAESPRPDRARERPRDTPPAGGSVVVMRPPEKTPLMIGGAAALVGAGALYYLSYEARQDFEGAGTKEDLERYAAKTNLLFIASAATLAAGASALTWGVAIDGGGPQIGLSVRF